MKACLCIRVKERNTYNVVVDVHDSYAPKVIISYFSNFFDWFDDMHDMSPYRFTVIEHDRTITVSLLKHSIVAVECWFE